MSEKHSGRRSSIEKLKGFYRSQNELVPLFDDPPQPINSCYIQLTFLDTRQLQERKEKMEAKNGSNEEKKEEREDKDEHEEHSKDGRWPNLLDHSIIYGNGQKTIELHDIWQEKQQDKSNKCRHISIRGEAGSGKSVLMKRIAYLWANDQIWNDQFQWILHIPLRKIVHLFDNNKSNLTNESTKCQWSKIMKELNIPQWDANDKKIVCSKNGLLLLDGFDEIANELNKRPGLRKWLQHCIENRNYCVIMTSRPNVMCSYLDNNVKVLNVIGFQSQDIPTYIYSYFQNISKNGNYTGQADMLIKTLDKNPNLKLLGHTPLYLRLLCYLSSEKKEDHEPLLNDLNNISLSKLYEKLFECYMKWNWIKLNVEKPIPNKQTFFHIFRMEIDYLSHIAWEGLKQGQALISCEIQQKVLDSIKIKHPRTHISVVSQWSRVNSFGILQGQQSINPSHPIHSVYFPHLTFQEWFAAYYLVNCLYQSSEQKEHQEVCSILTNEQLTPKYSLMIPFMAGILYNNIENKKDHKGSGLLYFWTLLHSSPPHFLSAHQMMLYMRCLNACKADTSSSFLSSQLQICHQSLIASFGSLLKAWINFDKDSTYAYTRDLFLELNRRIVCRPLNNVMEFHLPNLQHVLMHQQIHSYIINQLQYFQEQLDLRDDNDGLIKDQLRLLSYLCVSTKTCDIAVQCIKKSFKYSNEHIREICIAIFCAMAAKWSESQMNEILPLLVEEICKRGSHLHNQCVKALSDISSNLSTEQVHTVLKNMINAFNSKQIPFCSLCARAIGTLSARLDEKQVDKDAFEFLVNGLNNNEDSVYYACATSLEKLSMKLNEAQRIDTCNRLKSRLYSDNRGINDDVLTACTKTFVSISIQKHGKELLDILDYLMRGINNQKQYICVSSIKLLIEIVMKLHLTQLNAAFKFLMNGLKQKKQHVFKVCSGLLVEMSMKWHQTQLNKIFMDIRYLCVQAIQRLLSLELNFKQVDNAFNYLLNGLTDVAKGVQSVCVETLGSASMKWNKMQLNITFQCLLSRFNNKSEDILVRMSCAESLGRIAIKMDSMQLDCTLKCLKNGLSDDENAF
ncbi:hypothetical protein RFI_29269, partial [Reticulomyxa filosa]